MPPAPVHVPVIVGPTAAGKTALALALAERFPAIEIISADSRQIYIGMDIGTAKPSAQELRAVPHHMIDIITPDILYSAGQFAAAARHAITDIITRGNQPLLVGGSGFYVKALFEGLGAPTVDQELLAQLQERGEREGFMALYEELERIDPVAAHAHSPNNYVKTLRALCCYYQTGEPYSSFNEGEKGAARDLVPHYLGVAPKREFLYERINLRVLRMLEDGLLEETARLLTTGYAPDAPGLRTVGYAEAIRHLVGELDYSMMTSLIQQSTRRYAKRQMTWFRKVEGVEWLEGADVEAGAAWFTAVTGAPPSLNLQRRV